jgi:hypothetical protein
MSTAKKSTKHNSKPKTTRPVTKPSTAVTAPEQGYRSHKEGSRKGKVHQLFDAQGAEAAWVLGLKLKLKEGTLRSWFAAWKRVQSNGKEKKIETNSNATPALKPEGLTTPSEAAHL